jgi:translation initiation factor IF-1
MARADIARVEGVVVEQLPSGLYRLEIDGVTRLTAHLAPGVERNFLRLVVGDRVEVELSSRNLTRGRIVRKC